MITRDLAKFGSFARACGAGFGPACAKGVFLVAPADFALAEQSASDNQYMDLSRAVDPERAASQHAGLCAALAESLPTHCFPGDPQAPDGLFPNNAFATVRGRLILGHMRHAVRRRESDRGDIRTHFAVRGYREIDLRVQPGICELTGALVIDRARGLGFCGLSERCDEAGAAAMHAAFGLRATLVFDLAPGEYHTNVVLSVLAARAVVIAPSGFADPAVPEAIAELYAPHAIILSDEEKQGFVGNCISVTADTVWLSAGAADALAQAHRVQLVDAGFSLRSPPLDELEKAGGSLRC
ncbi:MAG: arginine deiminase-related protein, partial [Arenimonas sp.]